MASNTVRFDEACPPSNLTDKQFSRFKEILIKISSIDPYERHRPFLQMKAFVTWSRCIALIRKCDELNIQLRERTLLFQSIRDSYNRDVISVRHHLASVTELVKEHLKYDMYDVPNMPSTTIQAVVKRAEQCPLETSVQLRQTLINAGLLDRETGMFALAFLKVNHDFRI
jgi:hypothetical protein